MADPAIDRRLLLRWLALGPATGAGLLAGFPHGFWRQSKSESRRAGAGGVFDLVGEQCAPTGPDVQGPFYLPGAPRRTALAGPDEPGDPIVIRGTVLGPDCKTPLSGALLDVWQADAEGRYHDDREAYRLRGQLLTDAKGRYVFDSIVPGRYKLDGSFRPAHIHFTVASPRHETLTTQLYFKGDPYLAPNDACGSECRSDDPGRIIALEKETDGRARFSGRFDIALGALRG